MRKKYDIDPALTGVELAKARKLAYYYANKGQVQAQREANREAINARRREAYLKNKEVIAAKNQAWRESNREYARNKTAEWRAKDPERNAASKKAYAEANKDKVAAKQRAWATENIEKLRAYHRARYQKMPELYVAAYHRRRARKLLATPKWDQELTDLVTVEAARLVRARKRSTGFSWHVDHIVPLRGKFVSGLHLWNNLQVIPAVMNLEKANAFRG